MNRSHEYAGTLLAKARDDRYVLERLADDPGAPAWTLGFHAQQAVEKAVKAVLSDRGVEYPRTHDLAELVELARGAGVQGPPDREDLDVLTPYGAPFRYEADVDVGPVKGLDMSWAKDVVRRTLAWAENLLKAAGNNP